MEKFHWVGRCCQPPPLHYEVSMPCHSFRRTTHDAPWIDCEHARVTAEQWAVKVRQLLFGPPSPPVELFLMCALYIYHTKRDGGSATKSALSKKNAGVTTSGMPKSNSFGQRADNAVEKARDQTIDPPPPVPTTTPHVQGPRVLCVGGLAILNAQLFSDRVGRSMFTQRRALGCDVNTIRCHN
jgi:hypothetical protein